MKQLLDDSGSDVRCLLQEIVPEYKIWKKPESSGSVDYAEKPDEVQ